MARTLVLVLALVRASVTIEDPDPFAASLNDPNDLKLRSGGSHMFHGQIERDLAPYPRSRRHGPRLSYREIADRLENRTYEVFFPPPSENRTVAVPSPGYAVTHFRAEYGQSWNRQHTSGHLITAANPLSTFSVYEPGEVGGCPQEQFWDDEANASLFIDGRAAVKDTAGHFNCSIAVNAGFFDTHTGECHGNFISDGQTMQSNGSANVNFGVRADGSIVVGYLDDEAIEQQDVPFVQLIAGVVWLVRDGKAYVEESVLLEDSDTMESGTLNNFVTINSARVALGHDRDGNVKIIQYDGQSYDHGPNLHQVADMLVENGFVNAINLDGGGSATCVVNGSVVSELTDRCPQATCTADCPDDNRDCNKLCQKCARKVTTVACIHAPQCFHCERNGEDDRGSCTPEPCFTAPPTLAPSEAPSVSPTTSSLADPQLAARAAECRHEADAASWQIAFFVCLTVEVVTVWAFVVGPRCCVGRRGRGKLLYNDPTEPLTDFHNQAFEEDDIVVF